MDAGPEPGHADPRSIIARLRAAVRRADPQARLVPARVMRRVLREIRALPLLGLNVPHRKSLIVEPRVLKRVRHPDLEADELDPSRPAVLLAEPPQTTLDRCAYGTILEACRRALFHAHIHLALDDPTGRRCLTPEQTERLFARLGEPVFSEARTVLLQEGYLAPSADRHRVWVEFAAVFAEFDAFRPGLIEPYFPTLKDREAVRRALAELIYTQALLESVRMPDEADVSGTVAPSRVPQGARERRPEHRQRSRYSERWVRARAERAERLGNDVRAAIWRMRLAFGLPERDRDEAAAAARRPILRLCDRLRDALELGSAEHGELRALLPSLVEPAADGLWPPEARLLYDLQKAASDVERETLAIEPLRAIRKRDVRELLRPLPEHALVRVVRELRSARSRVPSCHVPDVVRERLAACLGVLEERATERCRTQCRVVIRGTLDAGGWVPGNPPERVSRDTIVEELLDGIIQRGHTTLGDLRDAVSRNDLKLDDLDGLRTLFFGDRLLRTDRLLASRLPAVHRRGEIYLRAIQKLSSLGFGTRVGRAFTMYIALPFGGAFVALKGLQHIIELIPGIPKGPLHQMTGSAAVVIFGFFLLGLLHSPALRSATSRAFRRLGRLIRFGLIDAPVAIFRFGPIRRVLGSRWFELSRRWLLQPIVLALATYALLDLLRIDATERLVAAGSAFAGSAILLNTGIAVELEDRVVDHLAVFSRYLWGDLLPGLFRLIMEGFRSGREWVERLIYTVDERLRFREGQGTGSLVLKTLLGALWGVASYVIRFALNLVVEPQVNPIKHFPVVTVSHKLVAPILFATLPKGLALVMQFVLPGMFGFMAWELRENWRIYRANRSKYLEPRSVGEHGETVARLLRPGFHSGTVPKHFAKLRRAARKAERTDDNSKREREEHALHEVAESIARFVKRETLALYAERPETAAAARLVPEVSLGVQRIRVGFEGGAPDAISLPAVVVEEREGNLVASFEVCRRSESLDPVARIVVRNGLVGLLERMGIDAVSDADAEGRLLTLEGRRITWDEWVSAWPETCDDRAPTPLLEELRIPVDCEAPEPAAAARAAIS